MARVRIKDPDAPTKYRAKRVQIGAESFDSRKEAKRFCDLQMLERGGEIADLERQVKIPLEGRDGPILTPTGRKAHYVADFVYHDTRTGQTVIEDVKGMRTPEYLLKRAILAAQGVIIREV